jgi:hypothetical protein
MDKLAQVRRIQCSVVIGNIQYLKIQKLNNNKILFLKICNQMKIMQDLSQELFFDCFKK